mmetsp:Transcript_16668/g.38449  ORF Transcript_16668/g.38449 Transcript_16668/m.38449 type:complete len:298 (-) Transcript_16668:221-1114(-)
MLGGSSMLWPLASQPYLKALLWGPLIPRAFSVPTTLAAAATSVGSCFAWDDSWVSRLALAMASRKSATLPFSSILFLARCGAGTMCARAASLARDAFLCMRSMDELELDMLFLSSGRESFWSDRGVSILLRGSSPSCRASPAGCGVVSPSTLAVAATVSSTSATFGPSLKSLLTPTMSTPSRLSPSTSSSPCSAPGAPALCACEAGGASSAVRVMVGRGLSSIMSDIGECIGLSLSRGMPMPGESLPRLMNSTTLLSVRGIKCGVSWRGKRCSSPSEGAAWLPLSLEGVLSSSPCEL